MVIGLQKEMQYLVYRVLPTFSCLQGVDPYEDFHETQSDLSSHYSSNQSSQSREDLQLPIVTAHLKTFHTQHASLPYDTITVTARACKPHTLISIKAHLFHNIQ